MDRRELVIVVLAVILVALLIEGAYTLDRNNAEEICGLVAAKPEHIDTRVKGYKCFVKIREGYWVHAYGAEVNDSD